MASSSGTSSLARTSDAEWQGDDWTCNAGLLLFAMQTSLGVQWPGDSANRRAWCIFNAIATTAAGPDSDGVDGYNLTGGIGMVLPLRAVARRFRAWCHFEVTCCWCGSNHRISGIQDVVFYPPRLPAACRCGSIDDAHTKCFICVYREDDARDAARSSPFLYSGYQAPPRAWAN